MLRNYFKIILRSLIRNKTFSLINLLGLSIGLAGFILIGLYVIDEFSFDRYHEKGDRVYLLSISADYNGQVRKWNGVPNLAAVTFPKEIPEIEKAVRILPNNFSGKAFVSSENIKSSENKLVWADSGIFDVLTIPFIRGNSSMALSRPHTVAISESAAIKYFGSIDVIGKSLKIDRDTLDFEVTGVFENPKVNSRFQFPVIASFLGTWGDKSLSWSNASFETYLLLHDKADPAIVEKKIAESLVRNIPNKDNRWYTLEVHPLKDIHLRYPDVQENLGGSKGDLSQLNILMGLGLIIILIAAVNYMNLSTAQSQRRFKEIGINKTLGATSRHLARKFYLETSVFVLLAMGISICVVVLSLPIFNSIAGKNFTPGFLGSGWFWIAFLLVFVVLTLLAGFYPASYLSSFSPKEILKGSPSGLGGNSSLRKFLVIVQFSVSIILIICTLILYQQLGFIRSKQLGYHPEFVIAIGTTGAESKEQINSLKTVLEGLASIKSVARSQSYPGNSSSGRTLPSLDGSGQSTPITTVRAQEGVINTLGIKLLAGKDLPQKDQNDTTIQVVLNKNAVDFLGLTPDEAVNRSIRLDGFEKVEIVGVTEDFHFASLREPISAYAFHNAETEGYAVLLVKIESNDLSGTMKQIESEFKKIIPSSFEFTFLDQHIQTLYISEQQLAKVIFIFAALAIFIACLGLYALAAYTTEQRTKEIGIRKVMGASVFQLSTMLSKDFLKLVIISFIIAGPVGYYTMGRWLEGYAYRIDISLVVIFAAGIISIGIAWLTVGFESVKAARSNPVESLRNE